MGSNLKVSFQMAAHRTCVCVYSACDSASNSRPIVGARLLGDRFYILKWMCALPQFSPFSSFCSAVPKAHYRPWISIAVIDRAECVMCQRAVFSAVNCHCHCNDWPNGRADLIWKQSCCLAESQNALVRSPAPLSCMSFCFCCCCCCCCWRNLKHCDNLAMIAIRQSRPKGGEERWPSGESVVAELDEAHSVQMIHI